VHPKFKKIVNGYFCKDMKMKTINLKTLCLLTSCIMAGQMASASHAFSQDRQWILGDWGGKRVTLKEQGYNFTLAFHNDSAINLSGGYNDDKMLSNANQLTFGVNLDLNKIAGWSNTEFNLAITKREGDALALERTADPRAAMFSSPQGIYGRGQSWRLSQASIKTASDDKRFTFKFGRVGLSDDFNGSHCEFQSLMLCGGQLGKTVGDIWYNGPVSQWGMNVKYTLLPSWIIGLGIYEINPENTAEDKGFNLDMDNVIGALIPLEVSWKPKLDVFNQLPGEYKVGGYLSTADAKDIKYNPENQIALTSAELKNHNSKNSVWLNAQQQVFAHEENSKRGLFVSANFTLNDKDTTAVQSSQQYAMWYKGPFDSRPNDSVGIGIAYFDINGDLRDRQNYLNEVNSLDSSDYNDPKYIPIKYNELSAEINYNYQWSPAIALRPSIMYFHQPGGLKEVDDAWVFGLTTRFNF